MEKKSYSHGQWMIFFYEYIINSSKTTYENIQTSKVGNEGRKCGNTVNRQWKLKY